MSKSIKPILSYTDPIRVKNGFIEVNDDGYKDIINSLNSTVLDVFSFKGSIVSKDTFKKWIEANRLGSVLNEVIVGDNNYLIIGANNEVYGYAISNEGRISELKCTLMGSNWTTLINSINDSVDKISSYNRELDQIINKLNPKDQFIQLVGRNHISDYISFEHLVRDTGEFNYVTIYDHPIFMDQDPIIYKSYGMDNLPEGDHELRYEVQIANPIYERIVKKGDLVELTIGYRVGLTTDVGDNEIIYNFNDPNFIPPNEEVVKGENKLYKDSETEDNKLIYNLEDPLRQLYFEDNPIKFNGEIVYYGQSRVHSVQVMVMIDEVIDSESGEGIPYRMNIGKDLMIEISLDRIVVYSINPSITEYLIKSARLLKFT